MFRKENGSAIDREHGFSQKVWFLSLVHERESKDTFLVLEGKTQEGQILRKKMGLNESTNNVYCGDYKDDFQAHHWVTCHIDPKEGAKLLNQTMSVIKADPEHQHAVVTDERNPKFPGLRKKNPHEFVSIFSPYHGVFNNAYDWAKARVFSHADFRNPENLKDLDTFLANANRNFVNRECRK